MWCGCVFHVMLVWCMLMGVFSPSWQLLPAVCSSCCLLLHAHDLSACMLQCTVSSPLLSELFSRSHVPWGSICLQLVGRRQLGVSALLCEVLWHAGCRDRLYRFSKGIPSLPFPALLVYVLVYTMYGIGDHADFIISLQAACLDNQFSVQCSPSLQ